MKERWEKWGGVILFTAGLTLLVISVVVAVKF